METLTSKQKKALVRTLQVEKQHSNKGNLREGYGALLELLGNKNLRVLSIQELLGKYIKYIQENNRMKRRNCRILGANVRRFECNMETSLIDI